MKSLFEPATRSEVLRRIDSLQAGSMRQWGKMDCAQMLSHLTISLENGTGDRPMKQSFLGRIIAPLFRKSALGEKPLGKNSPTAPSFVVADARDFEKERAKVAVLVQRFADRGPVEASSQVHPFFGKLSGDEWGVLLYKHIDHHLRQFSA